MVFWNMSLEEALQRRGLTPDVDAPGDKPGIAPVPAGSEDALAWLSEADIALYEAKQFGRNRVAVVKPRRPTMPPAELARQAGHPN